MDSPGEGTFISNTILFRIILLQIYAKTLFIALLCIISDVLFEPGAGAALSGGETTSNGKCLIFLKMYVHAPMFSGSSFTQITCLLFGYLSMIALIFSISNG